MVKNNLANLYSITTYLVSINNHFDFSGPIFGKYMHKLGVRRVYFFGVILTGVCALVFGTLDYIEDKVTFLVGFSKKPSRVSDTLKF